MPHAPRRPTNPVTCGPVFRALAVALAGAVALLAPGCASNVTPGINPPDVTTPILYSENRVYYLDPPLPRPVEGRDFDRRRLYQPYELALMQAAGKIPADSSEGDPLIVRHNDPLAVIISGVRLPDDLPDTYDVAVTVDIQAEDKPEPTALVVWYQRDVPGGQMLNFRDLLVYSTDHWDSAFAPYFRIRVLNTRGHVEQATASMLNQVGNLTLTLGGLMASPIIPGVGLAIEAGRQLLTGPAASKTEVLMDFTVQFYSDIQRKEAGGDLSQLRKGTWLVIGRPRERNAVARGLPSAPVQGADQMVRVNGTEADTTPEERVPSDFWRRTLFVDQQTGQVHDAAGRRMDVPYVAVTLSTANAQVPNLVIERSRKLVQLLASPEARNNLGDLEVQANSLSGSVLSFVAERRLRKYRSKEEITNVVELLRRHNRAQEQASATGTPSPYALSYDATYSLTNLLEQVSGRKFASFNDVDSWWKEMSTSCDVKDDPASSLGFRVVRKRGAQ